MLPLSIRVLTPGSPTVLSCGNDDDITSWKEGSTSVSEAECANEEPEEGTEYFRNARVAAAAAVDEVADENSDVSCPETIGPGAAAGLTAAAAAAAGVNPSGEEAEEEGSESGTEPAFMLKEGAGVEVTVAGGE